MFAISVVLFKVLGMCAFQGRPLSTKTYKASLLNPNMQSGVYTGGIFVNPRYRHGISHVSHEIPFVAISKTPV